MKFLSVERVAIFIVITLIVLLSVFYGIWRNTGFRYWFNPNQKMAVEYFNKINKLFEEARRTQDETKESDLGNPDPRKALLIVQNAIKEAEKIHAPLFCKKHYNLTIEILKMIADYQAKRIAFGDLTIEEKMRHDPGFDAERRNALIKQLKLEVERNQEYHIIQKH